MAGSAEKDLQRFEKASTKKSLWDTQYREGMEFVAPQMNLFEKGSEGQKKNSPDRVFDSTAQHGLDGFVSNLQSTLFPPYKPWIQLQAGKGIQAEDRDKQNKYLAEVTDIMFDYLRISNFDTQMSSAFYNYAFGVGALLVTKGTKECPLHFTAVDIAEIYLEEGPLGRIDTAFRQTEIEARNILGTWDDAELTEEMQNALADGKGDTRFCVVEGVIADEVSSMDVRKGEVYKASGYRYVVIDKATQTYLVNREQDSSPWVIFRWPGQPCEVYTRGPALKALADIKTLNKTMELLLKRGSRDLYGIYTITDEGVVNLDTITFGSSCFIPVESNGGARGASIQALPPTGDMNLGQFIFDNLQQSIFKSLYAEPLGRVDLPVKSATEIAYRQQELAKRIGAAFGKLQYELMIPLLNRILYILDDMGLIDLGGFKVDGRIINVEYMSPLALAQDQEELLNAQRYAEMMIGIYGPQYGMLMTQPDKFGPYCARKLHVPEELIPDEQAFNAMKQMLMQQGVQMGMANQQAAQQGAVAA